MTDAPFASDRFTFVVAPQVDCKHPGLYEWHIEGRGFYIGKYTRISRPTRQYAVNVRRLLAGMHYRKGKPDGFRLIHHELAEAVRKRLHITLTILKNCAVSEINAREQELIKERGNLNGSLKLAGSSGKQSDE